MPSAGSLFSGVGGFDLGFEQAGFTVAWQVEVDKDAVSVLERHWPDVPRYGDIATVDPADLAPVDVVIFGSPCQDFSVAGTRAGLDGARSGLFGEAIRIIRGLRPAPALVCWENVPGTLSSAGGRDFGAVLDALAGAGALDICWRILDARWFGVPQRRRRLFVVSDLRAERAAQVLFEPQGSSRHPAARGAAGQGAARDVADGAGIAGVADTVRSHPRPGSVPAFVGQAVSSKWHKGTSGPAGDEYHNLIACTDGAAPQPAWVRCADGCGDFWCRLHEQHAHDCECPPVEEWACDPYTDGVANSVTASAGHHGHSSLRGDGSDNKVVAAPLTAGGPPNSNAPGRDREDDENLVAVAFDWQGGGGNDESVRGKSRSYDVRAGDYAGSVSATKHDAVAFHLTQDPINGAESPALGAGNEHGCATIAVATPMAVRRLTPRECERLMGWPDLHTAYRADGSEIPDGPRYRMIGNGVVAPVARWIASRMLAVLEV